MQFPDDISSEEVDLRRFFGYLEDLGDSPPTPAAAPEATNPFSRSFFGAIEGDGIGLYLFTLLADVGTKLSILKKVGTEDEFIGEDDDGGAGPTFRICLGFTGSIPGTGVDSLLNSFNESRVWR